MKKLLSFIIVIAFFFSCKSKEKISTETATASATDTILLASIDRTACFGRCPTYKITIYQSGYVMYEGKRNVKNLGFFYSRIEKSKTDEIKKYITNNKIYELPDKNVNPHVADFPSTYTEININGNYKHITNTDPEAPQKLIEFEIFLDSFFTDDTNWIFLKPNIDE